MHTLHTEIKGGDERRERERKGRSGGEEEEEEEEKGEKVEGLICRGRRTT